MENGAKQAPQTLSPKEIVDKFTDQLFDHDAATQGAILDEVRATLISNYAERRDKYFESGNELDHAINVLKGNIPKSDSSIERDRGDVLVERKNFRHA